MWEEFRSHALPLLGENFPPELIDDNGDSIVFTRSSELSGDGGVYASCDEEHSESVVGGVSVDSGGASAHFDNAIDGFGGAIAGSGRVEVGQERVLPLAEVRPRQAISRVRDAGRLSTRQAARSRPWVGAARSKKSRTCWAQW